MIRAQDKVVLFLKHSFKDRWMTKRIVENMENIKDMFRYYYKLMMRTEVVTIVLMTWGGVPSVQLMSNVYWRGRLVARPVRTGRLWRFNNIINSLFFGMCFSLFEVNKEMHMQRMHHLFLLSPSLPPSQPSFPHILSWAIKSSGMCLFIDLPACPCAKGKQPIIIILLNGVSWSSALP